MVTTNAADLDALAGTLMSTSAPLGTDTLGRQLGNWPHERVATALDGLGKLGARCRTEDDRLSLAIADPLDAEAVHRAMPLRPPIELRLLRVCTSTNDLARSGSGYVLALAEAQTAGRGRRGSTWVQPFASGLALSLAAPAPRGRPDTLALALAAAAAEVLTHYGYRNVGLKWPNDLYAPAGKLGGVLVEVHGGKKARVVIGFGLNVLAAPRLSRRATAALADLGPPPPRSELAGRIAGAFVWALGRFERCGFSEFAARFAALDILAGREVILRDDAQSIEGIARGIGGDGALIIETVGGPVRCLAGEVSLGAWEKA